MLLRSLAPLGLLLASAAPAFGQGSIVACPSRQAIQQVINSDGQRLPDDCRTLTITAVETEAGELCVLEFKAPDAGILDSIAEAAVPTQWWTTCADLDRP